MGGCGISKIRISVSSVSPCENDFCEAGWVLNNITFFPVFSVAITSVGSLDRGVVGSEFF